MKKIILILQIAIITNMYSQEYSCPLNIQKCLLSGTFGELRSNHFHTGIDIKTGGVEGKEVYSIDDGYVSRIKVSAWGYGKAIYINHLNGTTSVYAHLKEFSDKIDSIVKKEHYKKESFEINLYPEKNKIPISKDEVIALSGNSGSSGGPHLHFEIRETSTSKPINPLSTGFNIEDNISPILKKLKIYTLGKSSINKSKENKIYNIKKERNIHTIDEKPLITGKFALGIYTYDQLNGAQNKNGIYSIKIIVDSMIIYFFKAEELDFNTNRYINAHIDYQEKKENNIKYHKCYKLSNNKLQNYVTLINNGIINFQDDNLHLIQIEVSDITGNKSTLEFHVQSKRLEEKEEKEEKEEYTKQFLFNKANIFKNNDLSLHMEKNTLYENLNFIYDRKDSIDDSFSALHKVHYNITPVHKKYVLSIKGSVPESLRKKTYIARKDKTGKFLYIGGVWKNEYLRAKVREFGDFCIIADTIKPEVKGLNIYPGKILETSQKSIKCIIKDKESGIKKYRGEINGRWILMDYDPKKNLLRFDIPKSFPKGNHNFILKVEDKLGNITSYIADFTL